LTSSEEQDTPLSLDLGYRSALKCARNCGEPAAEVARGFWHYWCFRSDATRKFRETTMGLKQPILFKNAKIHLYCFVSMCTIVEFSPFNFWLAECPYVATVSLSFLALHVNIFSCVN
jgi:hypothetical protein